MFEMVMARVCAIACGHEDAIDLDRLRHDPLMKVAVGRCPQSGAPLASQSTISRLESAAGLELKAHPHMLRHARGLANTSWRGWPRKKRSLYPLVRRPLLPLFDSHAALGVQTEIEGFAVFRPLGVPSAEGSVKPIDV
jgi:hypothetical protein